MSAWPPHRDAAAAAGFGWLRWTAPAGALALIADLAGAGRMAIALVVLALVPLGLAAHAALLGLTQDRSR